MEDPCKVRPFSPGERFGSLAPIICSAVSFIAIVPIFVKLSIQSINNYRTTPSQRRYIIKTHLDVYMMSLLVSDTVQAIGGMFSISWVILGEARRGRICEIQGFLKSTGDPGVSMTTMAITIHTFLVIALSWNPSRSLRIPITIVTISWTFRLCFYIVGKIVEDPGKPLMAPTPYYCWISDHYNVQRIPAAHIWHWLTTFLSIVLYISLFFIIRRRTMTPLRIWRRSSVHELTFVRIGGVDVVTQSKKMLWYPLVYNIVIVPFSVIRLISFNGKESVSPHWYLLCISLFNLGGLANVILLVFTRPHVLGFNSEELPSSERRTLGTRTTIDLA